MMVEREGIRYKLDFYIKSILLYSIAGFHFIAVLTPECTAVNESGL